MEKNNDKDVNADNIVISKLIEAKNNSKYSNGPYKTVYILQNFYR